MECLLLIFNGLAILLAVLDTDGPILYGAVVILFHYVPAKESVTLSTEDALRFNLNPITPIPI